MAAGPQQDADLNARILRRPLPEGFKGWLFYWNAFRVDLASLCVKVAMLIAPKTMRPIFDCHSKALRTYAQERLCGETLGAVTGVWHVDKRDKGNALRLKNCVLLATAAEKRAIRNGERPTFEKPGEIKYQFE